MNWKRKACESYVAGIEVRRGKHSGTQHRLPIKGLGGNVQNFLLQLINTSSSHIPQTTARSEMLVFTPSIPKGLQDPCLQITPIIPSENYRVKNPFSSATSHFIIVKRGTRSAPNHRLSVCLTANNNQQHQPLHRIHCRTPDITHSARSIWPRLGYTSTLILSDWINRMVVPVLYWPSSPPVCMLARLFGTGTPHPPLQSAPALSPLVRPALFWSGPVRSGPI